MIPTRTGNGTTTRRLATLGAAILCSVALLTAAAPLAARAPEPEPVARRWELTFVPGELRMASFNLPNVGPRRYFYMTYKVVNNSGTDLMFAPAFELANAEGAVIRSGRNVPQSVTESLVKSTQNVFMQDQIGIVGELMQGEENAKDGIAIWQVEDFNPDGVIVYVAGLSGETATVTSQDGKQKFVLRKTLRLDFQTPGNLVDQKSQAFPLGTKSWIMR